jgi:aspartate kinase
MMWKVPNIVSTTSSLVGEHGINILNLDAQEETSRILIVVEDKSTNVADAVVAIHSKRARIQTSKTKNE